MKTGRKTLAALLLLVGLVLVNYLASALPVRLDATADRIYSLSPGSRAILAKVEEPITLDLYFSKDAGGLPIAYKNYAARVEGMLREYVRASRGKLTLNLVNPGPDTPEEEKATAAGLTPQMSQEGGTPFFFGLVVTQAEQQKTIPAFTPQREQFLEYDLSQLLHGVQQFDKPKLGLLTALPLQGSSPQEMQMMMMSGRQPQPAQFVVEEWRQSFEIVPVDPAATALPAGLDVLAVVHPQNVSASLQYAIDQFLLGGKPVFLAVDPSSQYSKSQGRQQAMFGGAPPDASSNLPRLLDAYGIQYDSGKVVSDDSLGTQVQSRSQVVRLATWLSLQPEQFSAQALPTAQLNSALFVEAGALSPKPGSTLAFTPFIETTGQAGEIEAMALQAGSPEDASRQATATGKKALAALVTGKFKSAFPDGPPQAEKPADSAAGSAPKEKEPAAPAAPGLKESKGTSSLFVVADTDWLLDDYSVRKMDFLGESAAQPLNDNLAFAANVVEFLGGSQDLISIRGKGTSLRPFDVVHRMEVAAQQKYEQQLTALDRRLQEVQSKLTELQGQGGQGNRLVATPEMTKAIEDFRQQSTAMRAERRGIRRALREDIDRLENELLLLNLLVPSALVVAFGLWFHRARRRTPAVAS